LVPSPELSKELLRSLEALADERQLAAPGVGVSAPAAPGLPWTAAEAAGMHRTAPSTASVAAQTPVQPSAPTTVPLATTGTVQRKESPRVSISDNSEIEHLVNRIFPLICYRLRSEIRRENARSGSLTGMY
jgi:hypothetical protein